MRVLICTKKREIREASRFFVAFLVAFTMVFEVAAPLAYAQQPNRVPAQLPDPQGPPTAWGTMNPQPGPTLQTSGVTRPTTVNGLPANTYYLGNFTDPQTNIRHDVVAPHTPRHELEKFSPSRLAHELRHQCAHNKFRAEFVRELPSEAVSYLFMIGAQQWFDSVHDPGLIRNFIEENFEDPVQYLAFTVFMAAHVGTMQFFRKLGMDFNPCRTRRAFLESQRTNAARRQVRRQLHGATPEQQARFAKRLGPNRFQHVFGRYSAYFGLAAGLMASSAAAELFGDQNFQKCASLTYLTATVGREREEIRKESCDQFFEDWVISRKLNQWAPQLFSLLGTTVIAGWMMRTQAARLMGNAAMAPARAVHSIAQHGLGPDGKPLPVSAIPSRTPIVWKGMNITIRSGLIRAARFAVSMSPPMWLVMEIAHTMVFMPIFTFLTPRIERWWRVWTFSARDFNKLAELRQEIQKLEENNWVWQPSAPQTRLCTPTDSMGMPVGDGQPVDCTPQQEEAKSPGKIVKDYAKIHREYRQYLLEGPLNSHRQWEEYVLQFANTYSASYNVSNWFVHEVAEQKRLEAGEEVEEMPLLFQVNPMAGIATIERDPLTGQITQGDAAAAAANAIKFIDEVLADMRNGQGQRWSTGGPNGQDEANLIRIKNGLRLLDRSVKPAALRDPNSPESQRIAAIEDEDEKLFAEEMIRNAEIHRGLQTLWDVLRSDFVWNDRGLTFSYDDRAADPTRNYAVEYIEDILDGRLSAEINDRDRVLLTHLREILATPAERGEPAPALRNFRALEVPNSPLLFAVNQIQSQSIRDRVLREIRSGVVTMTNRGASHASLEYERMAEANPFMKIRILLGNPIRDRAGLAALQMADNDPRMIEQERKSAHPSSVGRRVLTPRMIDYLVAQMACGPDAAPEERTLVQEYRNRVTSLWNRLRHGVSDAPATEQELVSVRQAADENKVVSGWWGYDRNRNLVQEVSLFQASFIPPRLVSERTRQFCDEKPEGVNRRVFSHSIFDGFYTVERKRYQGLFEVVKNTLRADLFENDGKTSNLDKWWETHVDPPVIRTNNDFDRRYRETLAVEFIPAMTGETSRWTDNMSRHLGNLTNRMINGTTLPLGVKPAMERDFDYYAELISHVHASRFPDAAARTAGQAELAPKLREMKELLQGMLAMFNHIDQSRQAVEALERRMGIQNPGDWNEGTSRRVRRIREVTKKALERYAALEQEVRELTRFNTTRNIEEEIAEGNTATRAAGTRNARGATRPGAAGQGPNGGALPAQGNGQQERQPNPRLENEPPQDTKAEIVFASLDALKAMPQEVNTYLGIVAAINVPALERYLDPEQRRQMPTGPGQPAGAAVAQRREGASDDEIARAEAERIVRELMGQQGGSGT